MNKKNDFIFMWSLAPTIPGTFASPQVLAERADLWPDSDLYYYFDGKMMTCYMRESQLEVIKESYSKKFLNPEYFEEYQSNYLKEKNSWWEWVRRIEIKDYSKTDVDELKNDHLVFTTNIRDAIGYFFTTREESTFAAEQRLVHILKKYFGNEWQVRFDTLVKSPELDDIQKEHLDWLGLSVENQDDNVLLDHASKYPWLVFGQMDETKVITFLKSRQSTDKETHEDTITKLEIRKNELIRRQKEIFANTESDRKEAQYLANFLQTQSIERMEIKSYWSGCYYLTRNMLKAISCILNIQLFDLLTYVMPSEIQEGLSNPKFHFKEIVKERKKFHAFDHVKDGGVNILSGDEARIKFEKEIQPDINYSNKQISGQSASLGKFTGRVHKVTAGDLDLLIKNTDSFLPGEILVTSMTQPNMMAMAQRAGAIVADEGGITSHAAIIARELKIPCIVGTKIAMNVLEDGDLIEVDAYSGIVKKLS